MGILLLASSLAALAQNGVRGLRKKTEASLGWEIRKKAMKVDCHCHILPQIDDGSTCLGRRIHQSNVMLSIFRRRVPEGT